MGEGVAGPGENGEGEWDGERGVGVEKGVVGPAENGERELDGGGGSRSRGRGDWAGQGMVRGDGG